MSAGKHWYHATPYDLSDQTHILPPSQTGRRPHWEDMDPSEADRVFVVDSLDAAHGWGGEVAPEGQPYHVYEVEPENPQPGAHGMASAPRARIVRKSTGWGDSATPDATSTHIESPTD